MGANAQTSVPTFTAGQVLTAAQVNQINTGVPVASGTATRDALFGGSGEKTLAEGQLCYVESVGLQSYNGSSWVTWGTAPTSGLTLVKTQTIGSAVSSVEVTGAFSSTYDNYKITIVGGVGSTTTSIRLQMGSKTSNYRVKLIYEGYNNTPMQAAGSTTNASFLYAGAQNTDRLFMDADVFGPNLAKPTMMQANTMQSADCGWAVCYLDGTDQFTSFTVLPDSGTMTGGTIRVYGYQN